MTAVELLAEARAAGLRVNVQDGRLVVRGPRSASETANRLLARKDDIKALLAAPPRPAIRPHECGAGITPCSAPARLYPCGWRCPDHFPAASGLADDGEFRQQLHSGGGGRRETGDLAGRSAAPSVSPSEPQKSF
jgi:hypothetical protein